MLVEWLSLINNSHLFRCSHGNGSPQEGDHYELFHRKLYIRHFAQIMPLQNLPTESPLWHDSENISQSLFWRFLVDTVLLPLRHSFMCFLHFELRWLIVAPTFARTTQFIQLYNPQPPFPYVYASIKCIEGIHHRKLAPKLMYIVCATNIPQQRLINFLCHIHTLTLIGL